MFNVYRYDKHFKAVVSVFSLYLNKSSNYKSIIQQTLSVKNIISTQLLQMQLQFPSYNEYLCFYIQ